MHTRATFAGLVALVAVALLALSCSDSVTPERRAHPIPALALDAIHIAGQDLYVPSGFNVNLFAEGLDGPRSLALGPGGAVFVTLSDPGEIVRLVDTDGDGVADARSTVLSGLSYPVGLAFHPTTGELWANNNDRDNLGDDVPPEHLNILRDGRWYGWPQCYLPGQANPEY